MRTIAPFGSWKSPISSQLVTKSGVGLLDVRVDCNAELTDTVYWTELRFEEQGRYVICSFNTSTNSFQEWTPKDFSARTTVHEYGGGSFCVYNGAVYFSNFSDQVLYVQRSPDSKPEPVTDVTKKWRFADPFVSPKTGVLYCVREDHGVVDAGAKEQQNSLVAVNLNTKEISVLAEGCDFYSHPRVSPNGKKICWFQWNHPNMPWDDTEVWAAELEDSGSQVKDTSRQRMAGSADESAIEPGWTAGNELLYVSDKTNWWNLYHVTADGSHVNLCPTSSEIAGPQWQFGKTAYVADLQDATKIVTLQDYKLGVMDTEDPEKYVTFDTGFYYNRSVALTSTGDVFFLGSGPDTFPCVVRFNLKQKKSQVIKRAMTMDVDPGYLSTQPQFIQWTTAGGATSHGIFFPPANKDFQAPEGSRPPLLVRAHGGPTGHYFADLDLKLQYFTSRGFAVLLVNYRGSTGHGRTYRHLLRKMWGVYDMEDCCTAVSHLAQEGKVDPTKACIDGGSAGGYTTLACLTFKDTFKAGASHYGIGDLEALMKDTHKFESRYLDRLLLPLDDPSCKALLTSRSPIHHTQGLSCPIALFQGDQDKVVPPNQAEMMYEAVKKKGLPCMLVMFEGEQHGFRKAENIQAALDKEFCFFGKVLGFTPADDITDLPIVNL
ncbi:dipeptidyl-peptidase 5-like isoform X2 [Babylonia areolata]|uniref:dipeptidyl-peptidase 5-like isoform X1 n=1 Tax=Babylonia areolata TaxID=304850 RepID=UPI003FCF9FA5